MSLRRFMRATLGAFREEMVTSNLEDDTSWNAFDNRRTRYATLWAAYENTLYRNIHSFSQTYRYTYQLYLSTRSLINPAFTIGEFYKEKIWGGVLDMQAGEFGAIPITTNTARLRPYLAEMFKWSNWQFKKDLTVLKGTILGDVGLRIVDNVRKKRVYLEIIDPSIIRDVETDEFGNVKSYSLQYERVHPDNEDMVAIYLEEVTRNGDNIITNTYLNGELYAYPENTDRTGTAQASWSEPYGFVPLVFIKHIDTGDVYGWSELHVARSRINELDDLTSMLSDQIRKTVNVKWLIAGVDNQSPVIGRTSPTAESPEPWREETNLITTSNENASITALVAELDLDGTLQHIDKIMESLERDYPELMLHRLRTEGNAISGRALRIARQPAEAKVYQRRAVYDDALVRALQMGLSIGGLRGYFKGINLDSYSKGKLDIEIKSRAIYAEDPLDQAEVEFNRWQAINAAVGAGANLAGLLDTLGFSEDEIQKITPTPVEKLEEETNDRTLVQPD